jgi:hypothetical protein
MTSYLNFLEATKHPRGTRYAVHLSPSASNPNGVLLANGLTRSEMLRFARNMRPDFRVFAHTPDALIAL